MRTRALSLALLLAVAGCMPRPPRDADARAPFILPHALARAEKVYACEQAGWAEEVEKVPGIGARRVVRVPAFDEEGRPAAGLLSSWTTDEWLFGWKGRTHAVLKMPGDQGLADWGRAHFAGLARRGLYITPAEPREEGDPARRFDEGGAVVASPPVEGYPHGRIIVAHDTQKALKDFFRAQRVQVGPRGGASAPGTALGSGSGKRAEVPTAFARPHAPPAAGLIELDTSWLKVGHVDELAGFLPAERAPGFRLVVPDPDAAMKLLVRVPAERACFVALGAAEHAGRVTDSAIRWIDSATEIPEGRWGFVRIIGGRGAGQVAKVHKVVGKRILIDGVWDTRDFSDAKSTTMGLCCALTGRCDTMPIWFDRPDGTSEYLLVEGSKMWIDAAGEEFPAVMAAAELAGDKALARMNAGAAKRCREVERVLCEALGIDAEEDVLRLPVLFAAPGEGDTAAFALTPNLVNLQVFNREVVLLRPFFARREPGDDRTDLVLEAAREALAPRGGRRLHFLDGWDALHRNNGGARCGMNVWRAR